MMDLTAVIERYQDRFRDQYAARMTPDQHSALNAVLGCRSAQYGEMLLDCSSCHWQQTRFHSCGHRSCHRCQNHDTTGWLERQSQKLLPVEYFMVTFTLPYELRALAWQHQAQVYGILFACAVSTLKDFGANDKKLGARMGMTAVLHTHSRALNYHPHVHLVVPGGCLNRQRRQWKKLRGKYLFNAFALAKVFRARVLESIQTVGLVLPDGLPIQWVADCAHVGKGLPALKYLSRYLYRGVMNEKNLIGDDGTYVTFRYQDSQSGVTKTRRVKGEAFLWLLFQHALPKGFRRVRDYGFLHGNAKSALRIIQRALGIWVTLTTPRARTPFRCQLCKQPMSIIGFKPPAWRSG